MTHRTDHHHEPVPHEHEHEHEHHRHPSGWRRLTHEVAEIFGLSSGHSHDATDQVDAALEADARGRRALWVSLAALAVTAALQGAVVVVTGSVALLGDTLHNVADALTAVPLLVAFWLARKPANDRSPTGTVAPRIWPGCSSSP